MPSPLDRALTRSRLQRDHAVVTPESHVRATLPGWTRASGTTLISPAMGAGFVQYLALLEAEGAAALPAEGVERFLFVLDGEAHLTTPGGAHRLTAGAYALLPAGASHRLAAPEPARLLVLERRYQPLPGQAPPAPLVGHEAQVEGLPFLGDPDARLQTLIPDAPAYDLAMNLFTFQPGASLPLVEMHVMEHGLLMLAGQGVYRLSDSWYPVQAGDALWMAPFCPQWFAAIGKTPARYLYYKDSNRDPLAGAS
jgi:(S)-ureidoglycine aminohydrolase